MSILAKISNLFRSKPSELAVAPIKELTYEEKFMTVVKKLLAAPYEIAYCLDQNGDTVLCYTNHSTDRVEPDTAQLDFLAKHPGLTFIHNHPGEDVPPSVDDLTFAAKYKAKNCVVVSPNFIYNVFPSEAGWAPYAVVEYLANKHIELFKVIGYRYIEGEKYFRTETTEAALVAMIHDLGYGYIKSRITLCSGSG